MEDLFLVVHQISKTSVQFLQKRGRIFHYLFRKLTLYSKIIHTFKYQIFWKCLSRQIDNYAYIADRIMMA